MSKIVPVILSGGAGSRLWPLSRERFPKQLLPLVGERTLLQQAALRAQDAGVFTPPVVVANVEHRFVVAEQLREIGVERSILLLEPTGRNTAAAVAAAALSTVREDEAALILVMPADHHVSDPAAFREAVLRGEAAARDGRMVLFGMEPDSPATGYGWIEPGAALPGRPGVRAVGRFVEKPDLATAERFLAEGGRLWNSGVFLLPARGVLDELDRHEPGVREAVQKALDRASRDLDFIRLDEAAFAAAPSISIDHAVMERTGRAAVVPASFGWADVGAWSALHALGDADADGNVLVGDAEALDVKGSYLRGDGVLVAAVGVSDLIVVAAPDAVLVAPRSRDQDVRRLVDRLKTSAHAAAAEPRRVHRPWGWYERVDAGERFQVKRIMVRPGARLSLQKHARRAEHWVVVEGTAEVEIDGERRALGENESAYIPAGVVHRLGNPGATPLHLVEVQSGAYLGEDDIVRFEDDYART